MNRLWFALSVLALCWSAALAGTALDIDHACFRTSDTLGYVEVFAGIQRSALAYQPLGDSERTDFTLVLDVLSHDSVAISDTFFAQDIVDTLHGHGTKGQFFAHVFRMILTPGSYDLRATLTQTGSTHADQELDSVQVPRFHADSLELSSIELGTRLEFNQEPSALVKNGVLLVPNPTLVFGTRLPMFYYYAEAYGLDYDSAAVDSYLVTRRILDADSMKPVRPENSKVHVTSGNSVVVADGFPVTTLHSGKYFLELIVKSLRSGHTAVSRKKFWMYRGEDFEAGRVAAEPSVSHESVPFAMGILEIVNTDSALTWMKYVLTKDEAKQIERLNPDGKREFLHTYWAGSDAGHARNADQYFARVVEANRRYSFLKRPGWKTDRGRVFILYGEPDRMTRNYGQAQMPDHELWEYDKLDGGCSFVFMDRTGFGDLDLVHSTKRGEIYNPNWQNITPGRTSGGLDDR